MTWPKIIQKFGRRVLIITGGKSFSNSEAGGRLLNKINESVDKCFVTSIANEPTPEMIDKITSEYLNIPLDVIVSIGGGSVLDAGKAISAMLYKQETIVNYLEGVGTRQPDGSKVPL
ncbi:MAG: iron-containing alcohol dehydrogenase [Bacteroidales bacterium]|nr:iron-containing alcohol dehydrogenase [Bacteroidales bacterium]